MPEITSSNIIPVPPFILSTILAGKGFTISNILQTTNAIDMNKMVFGINNKDIHVPTNSSIVHCLGSFPYISSNLLPSEIPQTKKNEIKKTIIPGFSNPGIIYNITAARLAKVPGANFIYPVKKPLPKVFSIRFIFKCN